MNVDERMDFINSEHSTDTGQIIKKIVLVDLHMWLVITTRWKLRNRRSNLRRKMLLNRLHNDSKHFLRSREDSSEG